MERRTVRVLPGRPTNSTTPVPPRVRRSFILAALIALAPGPTFAGPPDEGRSSLSARDAAALERARAIIDAASAEPYCSRLTVRIQEEPTGLRLGDTVVITSGFISPPSIVRLEPGVPESRLVVVRRAGDPVLEVGPRQFSSERLDEFSGIESFAIAGLLGELLDRLPEDVEPIEPDAAMRAQCLARLRDTATLRSTGGPSQWLDEGAARRRLACDHAVRWRIDAALPELDRLGLTWNAYWLRILTRDEPEELLRDGLRNWPGSVLDFMRDRPDRVPPALRRRVLLQALENLDPEAGLHASDVVGDLLEIGVGERVFAIAHRLLRDDSLPLEERVEILGLLSCGSRDPAAMEELRAVSRRVVSVSGWPVVQAREYLVRSAGTDPALREAARLLLRAVFVTRDPEPSVRARLALALGRVAKPEDVPLLESLVEESGDLGAAAGLGFVDREAALRSLPQLVPALIRAREGAGKELSWNDIRAVVDIVCALDEPTTATVLDEWMAMPGMERRLRQLDAVSRRLVASDPEERAWIAAARLPAFEAVRRQLAASDPDERARIAAERLPLWNLELHSLLADRLRARGATDAAVRAIEEWRYSRVRGPRTAFWRD